jgi:hypothetical protein
MTRLARQFLVWISCGLGVVLILFLITALKHSFSTALSIVTESQSPYAVCHGSTCKSEAGIIPDLLGLAGYLVVPALIGTLAAVAFDVQRSKHYVSKEELQRQLEEHDARLPPRR